MDFKINNDTVKVRIKCHCDAVTQLFLPLKSNNTFPCIVHTRGQTDVMKLKGALLELC